MLQTLERADHSSKVELSVAAIIPLYNGAPFIREALESVLAQTEPADEIIVVNDGSTDEGPDIVADLASRHPIRLITQANGGIGAARNRGVAESKSTHFALLDQDDLWSLDHIEVLKRAFVNKAARDLGVVYANLDRIDMAGRMVRQNLLDEIPVVHPKVSLLRCLGEDMHILPGASLIAREAFDKVGRFDERLSGYEDDDLFLRIFSAGYRLHYLRKHSVLKWRLNTGSTSFSPRMARSRMIYFRKLAESYPDDRYLNANWTRDVIAPRFLTLVRHDLVEGLRLKDLPRAQQAWSDIQEIVLYMSKGVQRRMRRVAPIIERIYRIPLRKLTLRLIRYAVR
jgi:glycosyltransferase involved in cell wall biosynthesis